MRTLSASEMEDVNGGFWGLVALFTAIGVAASFLYDDYKHKKGAFKGDGKAMNIRDQDPGH